MTEVVRLGVDALGEIMRSLLDTAAGAAYLGFPKHERKLLDAKEKLCFLVDAMERRGQKFIEIDELAYYVATKEFSEVGNKYLEQSFTWATTRDSGEM